MIFYRIPLLIPDVVWATIFRDENHHAPSSSPSKVRPQEEPPPRKKNLITTNTPRDLQDEASSSFFFSFLGPATNKSSKRCMVRPPKEKKGERLGPATRRRKEGEKNKNIVSLQGTLTPSFIILGLGK